ncbi:MAG: YitT family protein [Clostridiaceae bacterium]|nr:YitT family protein [Clostridiaceae bacterium]MBW4859392.1 YitT family protein [Clostridiaceae bacterium]MBW4867238.1 YitT family protein [Clostridiaceae bacterium]
MLMVAIGLYFFFMPQKLAIGGANGLAIVVNHWIPFLSIGNLMIIINIVLFIVAFIFIGAGFGIKTIYTSLGTSVIVSLFENIIPMGGPLSDDIILQLVIGVFISAIGMAIVFNQNASTGGTDIIAKIINKFWGLELGRGVLLCDFSITLMAGIAFGPRLAMYSLLGVILNGLVIDSTIDGINLSKQVNIVSEYSDNIKDYIVKDLERGATLYSAKGAYTGNIKDVVVTVVDRKDFIKLKNHIKTIDENAFVTVSNVYEVLGDGFKSIDE